MFDRHFPVCVHHQHFRLFWYRWKCIIANFQQCTINKLLFDEFEWYMGGLSSFIRLPPPQNFRLFIVDCVLHRNPTISHLNLCVFLFWYHIECKLQFGIFIVIYSWQIRCAREWGWGKVIWENLSHLWMSSTCLFVSGIMMWILVWHQVVANNDEKWLLTSSWGDNRQSPDDFLCWKITVINSFDVLLAVSSVIPKNCRKMHNTMWNEMKKCHEFLHECCISVEWSITTQNSKQKCTNIKNSFIHS